MSAEREIESTFCWPEPLLICESQKQIDGLYTKVVQDLVCINSPVPCLLGSLLRVHVLPGLFRVLLAMCTRWYSIRAPLPTSVPRIMASHDGLNTECGVYLERSGAQLQADDGSTRSWGSMPI
jgi:hypothetical protein